jgi:hypothetical protein
MTETLDSSSPEANSFLSSCSFSRNSSSRLIRMIESVGVLVSLI